jgi:hypothetical protein
MTAPDYEELIRTLMWDQAAWLTDGEAQFLNSLNAWMENAPLTPKQIAKLQQIEKAVCKRIDESPDPEDCCDQALISLYDSRGF